MANSTIIGTVQELRNREVLVVSPDEPREYLRDLWVSRPASPSKLADIKLGDRVKMEYQSTKSYGLWFITEILK
jgi:hypothetical protein